MFPQQSQLEKDAHKTYGQGPYETYDEKKHNGAPHATIREFPRRPCIVQRARVIGAVPPSRGRYWEYPLAELSARQGDGATRTPVFVWTSSERGSGAGPSVDPRTESLLPSDSSAPHWRLLWAGSETQIQRRKSNCCVVR